jgi:hypothetical protein
MYFQLNKSKNTIQTYSYWNKNALLSIQSPIVLFTDQKSKQKFRRIRSVNITFIVYENVWELMKELEMKRNMKYIDNYLNDQWKKDPEKAIHNPNLYAIWNLKAYICSKVVKQNPYSTNFFIYSDLGAWRHGIIENWPDNNFMRILNEKLNDRLLFGQIIHVKDRNTFNVESNSIEGGFFAGSSIAIDTFAQSFYKIHDQRLKDNLFIGKDQTIMNYMAYKTNLRIVFLRTWQLHDCNSNKSLLFYDSWFFYQHYLSSIKNFNCEYEKRLSILTGI